MLLLIPGPVTTRAEVRAALGHDFAPWDNRGGGAHLHPARRQTAGSHDRIV